VVHIFLLLFLTHRRWGTQMCIFYFQGVEGGGTKMCFLFTRLSSCCLCPSVSDARNYLNVWSGSVTFLPPNMNIVCS
jgi:hypothetical protein